MADLFLDTSDHLIVGVLDDNRKWLEYFERPIKKSSGDIHRVVNDLLSKNALELGKIGQLFLVSGPGSYTGMRLSEGIAQILEWQGIAVNSFYHFDVPKFCGENRGIWLSSAFKGEYFVHRWDGEESENILCSKDDVENLLGKYSKYYSHFSSWFTDIFTNFAPPYLSSEMLREKADDVLELVKLGGMRVKPFYYRPEDKEFKTNQ
jgi:tRNA threonylcarbamoyladenosine biosynthesis protein TsaB